MAKKETGGHKDPGEYIGEKDSQLEELQHRGLAFDDLEFPFKKYIDKQVRHSLADAVDDSFYDHLQDPRFVKLLKLKISQCIEEDLKKNALVIMTKTILGKNKVDKEIVAKVEKDLPPLVAISKNISQARDYIREVLRNHLADIPDRERLIRNIDDDIRRRFEGKR